jgi:hypothetical protein
MDASAQAVVGGAEQAVRRLPGGPILAAAIRPGPSAPSNGRNSAEGSAGTAGGGGGAGGGVGGVGGGEPGGAGGSVEDTLARNQDMNLYYLDLQERISAENRTYTALSNVLKARHDTVKNAIGNIR